MENRIKIQSQNIQNFIRFVENWKATPSRDSTVKYHETKFKILEKLWFEIDNSNDEIALEMEDGLNRDSVEKEYNQAFSVYDEAVVFYFTQLHEINDQVQHQNKIYQSIIQQNMQTESELYPKITETINVVDQKPFVNLNHRRELNIGQVVPLELLESKNKTSNWPEMDFNTKEINFIEKPPHLRSSKQLRQVQISQPRPTDTAVPPDKKVTVERDNVFTSIRGNGENHESCNGHTYNSVTATNQINRPSTCFGLFDNCKRKFMATSINSSGELFKIIWRRYKKSTLNMKSTSNNFKHWSNQYYLINVLREININLSAWWPIKRNQLSELYCWFGYSSKRILN